MMSQGSRLAWLYAISKKYSSQLATLGLLLVVAFALRSVHLGDLHTVQADEYSWMLAGNSLLHTGTPSSWTIPWSFTNYSVYYSAAREEFNGEIYWVVTPWLDHPPLFSLLIGSWLSVMPVGDIHAPAWVVVRLPMVGVAIATILCTFLFVYRLAGKRVAWLTLLAYTFFPASVLTSRFALAENVITLWLIGGLLLAHVFLTESRRRWVFIALCVIAVTAPLLKLSGAVVPGAIALILFMQKKYKLATIILGMGLLAGVIFATYGWLYDWQVFLMANQAHALRPQSIQSVWSLIAGTNIANLSLFDPSIMVGFAGLALFLAQYAKKQAHTFVVAPLFVGLCTLLLVAPVEAYSWYAFPLYPLIALGLGYVLSLFVQNVRLALVLLLPLVLFATEKGFSLAGSALHATVILGVGVGLLLFTGVLVRSKQLMVSGAVIALLAASEVLWAVHIIAKYSDVILQQK